MPRRSDDLKGLIWTELVLLAGLLAVIWGIAG